MFDVYPCADLKSLPYNEMPLHLDLFVENQRKDKIVRAFEQLLSLSFFLTHLLFSFLII
jgi:hypothetical protein